VAIERRLARLGARLSIARDRVLAWACAQAVLSAIWMIEDGASVPPDDPTLRLAQGLEEMLAPR
jgi:streptomycin 6-kinase